MLIRRAQLADMPDLARLLDQVREVHHVGRPDLFKASGRKYTDAELEVIIADETRPIFVATEEAAGDVGAPGAEGGAGANEGEAVEDGGGAPEAEGGAGAAVGEGVEGKVVAPRAGAAKDGCGAPEAEGGAGAAEGEAVEDGGDTPGARAAEDGGGGRVLGYAFCEYQEFVGDNVRTDLRTLYVDDICVDETRRGGGVGRRLYEHVVSFAREQGFSNVTLNVWSCNPGAQAFYEAMGMKPYRIGMEVVL